MDGDFGIENVAQEKDMERTGNHTELVHKDSAGISNRDLSKSLRLPSLKRAEDSTTQQSAKLK